MADSKTNLLKLARMQPAEQKKVAEKIAAGQAKTVKDAQRVARQTCCKRAALAGAMVSAGTASAS